ncbi:MAG: ArsR/SmtB family transcription factor [Chloroflexota bacterium]
MLTIPAKADEELREQFARIGKVIVHPKRIELLELLCQGERSVESLTRATGLRLTTASAHLQILRQARLVETRRDGVRVLYRAAGEEVCRFVAALGDLARARLGDVERILRRFGDDPEGLEPMTRPMLLEKARRGEVMVLDMRPEEEYRAGHIPGALSIPLDRLADRLGELSATSEVVAYCRGPYCLLAPQAVALLRRRGFRAVRLAEGMPEWRGAGLPVAVGAEQGGLVSQTRGGMW